MTSPAGRERPYQMPKREAGNTEVPEYVQEAEDRELEAIIQTIFNKAAPPERTDLKRFEGTAKEEIRYLEAYNALLDRRDLEAFQAKVAEAHQEFLAVREGTQRARQGRQRQAA